MTPEIITESGLVVVSERELLKSRRMVVKLGSNVTTNSDGSLNMDLIDSITWQTSELFKSGVKLSLVVSGAVKHGKKLLQMSDNQNIEDMQLEAARGNGYLQMAFAKKFDKWGVHSFPQQFSEADLLNSKVAHLLSRMMESGIPIINANDSVNDEELKQLLKSADNDKLAGVVAQYVKADTLLLLTDVDGILDVQGEIIEDGSTISIGENVLFKKGDGTGPGGPGVKYGVLKRLSKRGIRGIVASANCEQIIIQTAKENPRGCTIFQSLAAKQ